MKCIKCSSYAVNHHCHGRDGTDPDLCDVCFWRKRANRKPLTDEELAEIAMQSGAYDEQLLAFARAIEAAHGIKGGT
jgi:hypothetical protein